MIVSGGCFSRRFVRALLHERLFWQIAYLHLQGGGTAGADKKKVNLGEFALKRGYKNISCWETTHIHTMNGIICIYVNDTHSAARRHAPDGASLMAEALD